jgi:nicotinamidase-related amidase
MSRAAYQRIALVVLDMQNDAISEGGAFAGTGAAEHAREQDVVANVAGLAAAFRATSAPVIHVWYVVESGAHELAQNAHIFEAVRAEKANVRGTWGAAPVDGLEPQSGDFVVEKLRMNAFHGTRLDPILRGLDVDTLVLAGAWTNMSVEHTARHAADAGYRVVVASDGTSTLNAEWQGAALGYALAHVATVLTCAEIKAALPRTRSTSSGSPKTE